MRSLHPSENVVIPRSCYRELDQPDNCFPSSVRFEINYKYFFDRFSGILPQNSGTVTIPFWKQANRSIKQETFVLFFKEQRVPSPIWNTRACPSVLNRPL